MEILVNGCSGRLWVVLAAVGGGWINSLEGLLVYGGRVKGWEVGWGNMANGQWLGEVIRGVINYGLG